MLEPPAPFGCIDQYTDLQPTYMVSLRMPSIWGGLNQHLIKKISQMNVDFHEDLHIIDMGGRIHANSV